MNLKYMNVSLFEIGYKKNEISHHILIFGDVSVNFKNGGGEKTQQYTVKFFLTSTLLSPATAVM